MADLPAGVDPGDLARSDPDRPRPSGHGAAPFLGFRVERALAPADLTATRGPGPRRRGGPRRDPRAPQRPGPRPVRDGGGRPVPRRRRPPRASLRPARPRVRPVLWEVDRPGHPRRAGEVSRAPLGRVGPDATTPIRERRAPGTGCGHPRPRARGRTARRGAVRRPLALEAFRALAAADDSAPGPGTGCPRRGRAVCHSWPPRSWTAKPRSVVCRLIEGHDRAVRMCEIAGPARRAIRRGSRPRCRGSSTSKERCAEARHAAGCGRPVARVASGHGRGDA